MRRRHAVSFAVHDEPGKQARLFCSRAKCSGLSIIGQLILDEFPVLGLNHRFVLTRVDLPLMSNLAAIDWVLQQRIKSTARKPVATRQDAAGTFAALTHDTKPTSSSARIRTEPSSA